VLQLDDMWDHVKQVSEHAKPYLEVEVEQACTRAVNTPSRESEAEQPLCTANAL